MINFSNGLSVCVKPLLDEQKNSTFSDLKFLYDHSDKQYKWSDNPEECDIILIALPGNDISLSAYARSFLALKLTPEELDKAFAVSLRRDKLLFLLRGVYESAGVTGAGKSDRIRSGAYTEKSFNELIEKLPVFDGDQMPQQKKYLYSFIGRNCHRSRQAIYNLKSTRSDVLIENSSHFNVWSKTKPENFEKRLQHYTDVIQSSKFSLCPRGFGASSIRLFESMKLGVCPVIISDEWKLPKGPDWNTCSVMIHENQVHEIEKILMERERDYRELGNRAAEVYKRNFSRKTYFNWIIDNCVDIQESQKLPERYWWKLRYAHYVTSLAYRKCNTVRLALKHLYASLLHKFRSE